MITKYAIAGRYKRAEITAVEIVRETAQCVFLPTTRLRKTEQKEAKRSEWREYYDTWAEAHAALMADAQNKLANARRALAYSQSYAGNVKGMKPPPEHSERNSDAPGQVTQASQNESTQKP